MTTSRFSVLARIRSFRFAINGILRFLRSEHNAWIHLLATVVVVAAGFSVGLNREEWIAIVVVTGLVWIAELVNTCFEKLLDLLHPAKDPRVAVLKDMAAGAVLIAAIVAAVAGLLIFIPHFY